jgi:integrase
MKHANFSAKRVAAFQCKPGKSQSIYWDGYAPGLGLRVTAAGAKSYIFEAWLHGRCVRVTIGDQRTWGLGKAQDEATRLKTLTDQGLDPRGIAAEQKIAADATRTQSAREAALVGNAWQVYIKHREKHWGARHLQDHQVLAKAGGEKRKRGEKLTVDGVLYPLMGLRLVDIMAPALIDWQIKEAKCRANNARQGFELFRTFWRWCASRPEYASVVDAKIVDDKDLREDVPSKKTHKHDVLQRAHLKPWFAAVRGLTNPIVSAYLQALVLTGARREEMAELRWEDVDFQWKSLWVKDKVAKEGRKVPLTPYLASILAALPRKNHWVFSSPTASGGKIVEPRIPHNRALSVGGLDHVTLQGLRRTFSSLAEWVEIPHGVVAQIMGHAPNATAEKHYINRPLELLARWHCKYESWILQQAGIAPKRRAKPKQEKGSTAEKPALRLVASR